MVGNRHSTGDRVPGTVAKAIHDHWILFVVEGVALIALGLVAIVVPSIASVNLTVVLGWLFLVSGAVGLATTYWARQAPGFWWSLVSALLAIAVGFVLIANESQDLYGGLMGWPFANTGPMRLILVLFFLVEGVASIMFAFEHRRRLSGRWAWMAASGVVDVVLASVIIFDLPGTSAWTMGLLVGINMVIGGFALLAMGLHACRERAASDAILPRDA
ncbi:MAG: HdeD family acid-resistance protein [Roseiarcus sp.]|jgi:uncharacterized membrane protein HdeD (DUF308 family)